MRIGVLTDTHAASLAELPEKVVSGLREVDLIVHCGDFTAATVLDELRQLGRVMAVHGNMDSLLLKNSLPEREYLLVGRHHIGITHGWGAPGGIEDRLRYFLPEADIIIFGHTHRAQNRVVDGIRFFNAGSARNSYGILTVGETVSGEIIEAAA